MCLRHKNEMVVFEAARAICSLRKATAGDLVHALEALIAEEGGADLVIAGHVHEYERSHATRRNGKVVARGGKVTHYHQGTSPCVFHEVFYI